MLVLFAFESPLYMSVHEDYLTGEMTLRNFFNLDHKQGMDQFIIEIEALRDNALKQKNDKSLYPTSKLRY